VKLEQVGRETCARALAPGQVKRHPFQGPALLGYFVACPACGFRALHDDEAGFLEHAGRLEAAANPLPCLACKRAIRIDAGTITAT